MVVYSVVHTVTVLECLTHVVVVFEVPTTIIRRIRKAIATTVMVAIAVVKGSKKNLTDSIQSLILRIAVSFPVKQCRG